MKIYKVQYKRGNLVNEVTVAADTVERATQDAERHLKSTIYNYEIVSVTLFNKVDVFFKTPAKKNKKK